jgi:hypothetical protein
MAQERLERGRSTSATGVSPGIRTRAFGLNLEADFDMPGVQRVTGAADGRFLSLRLADLEDVRRGFPEDADRILEVHFPDGRLAVSIDSAGDAGYLAYAFDFGHARLGVDGSEALITPFDEPPWVWQRYLTGQLLPLAAVLQGYEVFHACVLGLDGRAIAMVAHSGIGKTTIALRLALEGMLFMSDDVLVVEPDLEGVTAHPGISLANVRPGADKLLSELEAAKLASPVGASERETRISIRQSGEPRPLAALFVLTRYGDPRELRVEHLDPVEPRILLAATFNFSVRTPERMARQLDMCARVDRSAPVFRVSCGSDVGPEEVTHAIRTQASDLPT